MGNSKRLNLGRGADMLNRFLRRVRQHIFLRLWEVGWPLINKGPFFWKLRLQRGWISYLVKSGIKDAAICESAVQRIFDCFEKQKLFFIQIGANDGKLCDPIFRHATRAHWQGILVEPLLYYFELLKRNYGDNKNLIFENIAIGGNDSAVQEGYLNLYHIDEAVLNKHFISFEWLHGQGSFRKEVVEREINGSFQGENKKMLLNSIKIEIVKWISFNRLIDKYRLKEIDLLLMDTQGFDYFILMSIDFERIRVKMIYFESMFFNPMEWEVCSKKLIEKGYTLLRYGQNTFAFQNV